MDRRDFFPALLASSAAALAAGRESTFSLEEATVAELSFHMRQGQLTAEHIARLYLHRMEALDRPGPGRNAALRSVLEVNPDALEIAASLDRERKHSGPRGPLHGIPVLLKDNIDTHDRMRTTAGSLALLDAPTPRQDSFVAARLRAAGAVLLGKTNLSEWANFRSTRSVSGWSARGGQTRNPYALDRNPCGSSSGSGVAVSANLAALSVGTETDGSIICPSAMNGIVGIKPTVGLVSRSGIIPIAHSQDTAGPMARTVLDAALLLSVLAHPDASDSATAAARQTGVDYTAYCRKDGLRGARLGVARQYFTFGPKIDALMNESMALLRRLGAELVDPVELSEFDGWRDSEATVLFYEFKTDLGVYLANRGGPCRTLADVIAFNRSHARQEMPYFGQELMEQSQQKGSLRDKEYTLALAQNRKLAGKNGIDEILQKRRVDAIIAPTAGPAFVTDLVNGDHIDSGCASPAAVAGYPHITVPAGHIFGLPVGLSFFGTAWTEPKLIQYAYAFEQALKARASPRFLPSAPLDLL